MACVVRVSRVSIVSTQFNSLTHADFQYASGQDQKYPPDRYAKLNYVWPSSLPLHCSPGEAAGDNGRVWKIYRDRVKVIDDDLLEGWNDTLNVLLTFVRL